MKKSPQSNQTHQFTLQDFSTAAPFSSFLPGIAGALGIPMWVFYTNRGQAISSFGVESKDGPIMEFQPANKAYQRTASEGFRTFIKWETAENSGLYEPFSPHTAPEESRHTLTIGMSDLTILDENPILGLKTQVNYFTLPGEPFAALARQVTITNTGLTPLKLEVLDGMPLLIPYGIENEGLKAMARTMEAWMAVFHHESGLPFFRLGATPGDTAEVQEIRAGHFALGFSANAKDAVPLTAFVDPNIIFGNNTTLSAPTRFRHKSLEQLAAEKQITVGKTPCAFFGHTTTLKPGESLNLNLLFGHVNGYENIAQARQNIQTPAYFAQKHTENHALVNALTDVVATQTSDPRFDAYTRQTFLDNVLRGGWPLLLGDEASPQPYHIYSRKHGDPERDYNHFFLAAEFYSQGNGNFRDVCQNRRCDVLLEPRLAAHNIHTFLSLIQLDGYNPLVIQGTSFSLSPARQTSILNLTPTPGKLAPLLAAPFTPGGLLKQIQNHNIKLQVSYQQFIQQALQRATPHLNAAYGEGFWVDHWTYLLDLIENFLAVYPDRKEELLFGPAAIPFYQSPARVRPRKDRYVLTERGVRQYDAVAHTGQEGWVCAPTGETYHTTVFGKLLLLAGIKFGTRDPEGLGVEMEAGKPGWYDALNGLPGLLGSSMPEAHELLRLIKFLREALKDTPSAPPIDLPAEFGSYFQKLAALTETETNPLGWWQKANDLRESYRETIYQDGISGQEIRLAPQTIDSILNHFELQTQTGLARAQELAASEVPPTYFRFEVTEYHPQNDAAGRPRLDQQGRPYVQASAFRARALPPFLEGPVRALKVAASPAQAKAIHTAVRHSDLYDPALKMYKVNAPLENEPHEIGRARAFTPGWLENESIWLHMAYKYLLELLDAGLYADFFEAFRQTLIPFLDPKVYRRSPLENSSFLVSSAHPDASLHGAGFVARLSGSTAEFMSIWSIMMAGKQPFRLQDGELILDLQPIIPGWLFDEHNQVKFTFLGAIDVTYHNPQRADTWRVQPQKINIQLRTGETQTFQGATIPAPYAKMVRAKNIAAITIHFSLQ